MAFYKATSLLCALSLPVSSLAGIQQQVTHEELDQLKDLLNLQQEQHDAQQRLLEEQMRQLQAQQEELEALQRKLAAATMAASRAGSTHRGQTVATTKRNGGYRGNAPAAAPQGLAESEPMVLRDTRGGQSSNDQTAQRQQQPAPQQKAQQKQGSQPKPQQVGQSPAAQQEKRSQPLSVADVVRDQSILTPKGTFVFTPSLAYTNDSNIRTAVTGFSILPAFLIGIFDVRKIDRNTLVANLTGRYGLTDKTDVEFKIPYVYRDDSVLSRPLGTPTSEDTRFSASGHDIGDIEAAFRYQFRRPSQNWPFFTGGLRVKSNTGKSPYDFTIDSQSRLPEGGMPTGTGFWGIKPSLFFLYPSDPVVYFGELSYQWNVKGNAGTDLSIDPGDYIGIDFGMGFALNEKASFTLGYQHRTILKTRVDGEASGDTLQVASFVTSFAYKYAKNASVNLSIANGLTESSPDLQVTLSFPISFDL